MKSNELRESKIDVRIKIAALWGAMMMLYIYNDFFHLFKPDAIQDIMDGSMGLVDITQIGMFVASVMMAIPVIMGLLTLVLQRKASRIANIIAGSLYTVINVANLPGEWAFYIFLGILQIAFTLLVIWYSVKWK